MPADAAYVGSPGRGLAPAVRLPQVNARQAASLID
jgi:hypothetical protein